MRIFRKSLLFLPAAILSVAVCTGSPGAYARPQSHSDQSVAEAARKAKEQKKKSDKPVKTITDEDIAAKRAAAAKEGAPPESSTEKAGETEQAPAAEKASGEKGAAASTKEEIEKLEAELKQLKEKLADAQKDLNLLQRDFTLQKDQFYSKPDFNRDTDGKAKLDGMQNQILNKQQDVDSLKTRVAALQELINRAKHETPAKPEAPAKPATPPPPARVG